MCRSLSRLSIVSKDFLFFSNKIKHCHQISFSLLFKLNINGNFIRSQSNLSINESSSNEQDQENRIDPKLLFDLEASDEKVNGPLGDVFKFGELVSCRLMKNVKLRKPPSVNNRIIKLHSNGILKFQLFEVFHEHIRHLKSLTFKNFRYDFKRPSLYEYITLKVSDP